MMDIIEFGIFLSEFIALLKRDFQDGKITGKEFKELLNRLIDDDAQIDLDNILGFIRYLREKIREKIREV